MCSFNFFARSVVWKQFESADTNETRNNCVIDKINAHATGHVDSSTRVDV